VQTNEIRPLPYITHNNSKWVKYLKISAKTKEYLEENIRVNLHDLESYKRFSDMN
jgi:hypothetical protein